MPDPLRPTEIDAFRPAGRRFEGADRRAPLRAALARWDQLGPGQTAGRFWPMACVALEVTQRCNLDCTLCYLSEAAEALHDVPLTLLVERLDAIHSHYGPGTSIQITGGDPTLRPTDDLEALCREIRARGMRSCLMTNGIRATRALLRQLRAAGLDDIAFHVDLTQERRGYRTEADLDALREDYLARARGLGLRVLFNTTVFAGNLDEIAHLARFFRRHAREIAFVSFQLQADTGRGSLRERAPVVTREAVMAGLEAGFQAPIDFDVVGVGHAACNRHGSLLVAGDIAVSPLRNHRLVHRVLAAFDQVERRADRDYIRVGPTALRLVLRRPGLALAVLAEGLGLLWSLRHGLAASRGRVHRLSLFVHDFMDADDLQRDRCESCVFMVATQEGPLSMCLHNARRDAHLLQPALVETDAGRRWWNAATGDLQPTPGPTPAPAVPAKRRKGRDRVGLILLPLLLGACSSIERAALPPPTLLAPDWSVHAEAPGAAFDHGPWDAFLATYVATDAEGVNRVAYAEVTAEDRAALDAYLASYEATDPATLDRDDQLAWWLNLYNALTVDLVLDAYPVDSIRQITDGTFSFGPWDRELITVNGMPLTLNDIEHRIIRPVYGEPRIHYAVNCAATSCPNLMDRAWQGDTLEADLAAAEHAYVHDVRGVSAALGGELTLSKIYIWFQEDFGPNEAAVIAGLAEVADPPLRGRLVGRTSVDAYAYDWSLNDQAAVATADAAP